MTDTTSPVETRPPQSVVTPYRLGFAAHYALAALTVAATIAFLDRLLINLVVDPIRTEAGISDTQFSLLQGAAFSVTYTLAMLPIAWASDLFNRKYIIIAAVTAWSLMTIAFGLAEGFIALLLIRAGVALGEAGLTPAATSILRDIYPRHRQAMAISTLTIGTYVGGAISLAVGGPMLSWLQAHAGNLPGDLSPWRYLFIAAGSLGAVSVALLLFMREPKRERGPAAEVVSWRAYLELVWAMRARTVPFLLAFVGFHSIAAAAPAWLPALFMRAHHWSPEAVGVTFGVIQLTGGILGAIGAGWLVDRLASRGDTAGLLRVVLAGVVAAATGTLLAALLPNPVLALIANGVATFGKGICIGLGGLGFQQMFSNRFSARAMATYVLAIGVFGGSIGPTAVPMIASLLGLGTHVGPALALWAAVAGVWTVFWLLRCLAASPSNPANTKAA